MRLGDRRYIFFVWVFATCVAAEPADDSGPIRIKENANGPIRIEENANKHFLEMVRIHQPTNILPLAPDSCWQGFNN